MSTDPTAGTLHRDRPRARALEWCLERRYSLVVWASMLAWSGALFSTIRSDYLNFRLARFDLGNMVQAVWSTAHGHPLEYTNGPTGDQMVRLGAHVDPILVLLTPLWLAWPSPLTLAFAQIVAVSLGALPIYWLARRHLTSEKLACLLALTYLAYPWLAWTALDAIHPVTLAIPLFLYCIWFLDANRLWAFAPLALLIAMTGELMGLTIATLGIWYALARRKRWEGIAIATAGIAWTTIAVEVVVPAFSGSHSGYYMIYGTVGGSPRGVVRMAFTHPGTIVSMLARSNVILYLVLLAAPLAGLFLLAPGLAAVGVPQLLVNGLADGASTTDPRQHYIAAVIPFLLASVVLGLVRLRPARRAPAASVVLALCVVFAVVIGPWPGAPGKAPLWYQTEVSPKRVVALRNAAALVPDGAAVSATNKVGSHLSERRYIYSVPVIGRAKWILLDMSDPRLANAKHAFLDPNPGGLQVFRRRIEQSPRWTKVFDEDGVLVFRRT